MNIFNLMDDIEKDVNEAAATMAANETERQNRARFELYDDEE